MYEINKFLLSEMLAELPSSKKAVLKKALDRNELLTSSRVLEDCKMTVYKEGWYIQLEGTRCSFSFFVEDDDGKFRYKRKPNERKLNWLYDDYDKMSESFFTQF